MQSHAYSVVAPMHNEQGNVQALFDAIQVVMARLDEPYEIIFVNDASTDATLQRMQEVQRRERHFRYVDLQYNVGENWALLAGISKARGAVIISIDGDYQNDPGYIPELLKKLAEGHRVVSGRRRERAAAFWTKRLPSMIANGLIRWVSGVPVHDCGCGLKAYRREVVEGKYVPKGFMNRFSPVSLGVQANEFAEVEIVDRPRISGESHYGLGRIFIVLRDLWALPFALRGAAHWLNRFRVALAIFVLAALLAAVSRHWFWAGSSSLLALACYSNVTNLARFVEAQNNPAFRIKDFR